MDQFITSLNLKVDYLVHSYKAPTYNTLPSDNLLLILQFALDNLPLILQIPIVNNILYYLTL